MKTLKLKVVHRILIHGMLNTDGTKSGNFTLKNLSLMLKILDRVNFSEEEAKVLNIRVEEGGTVKWNAFTTAEDGTKTDVDVEKEIELSDDQAELLKDIMKQKNERKEFTLNGLTPMMEIAQQLGFEI